MKIYDSVGKTGFPVMLDKNVVKTAGFEAGDRLEINVEESGNRIIITKAKKSSMRTNGRAVLSRNILVNMIGEKSTNVNVLRMKR